MFYGRERDDPEVPFCLVVSLPPTSATDSGPVTVWADHPPTGAREGRLGCGRRRNYATQKPMRARM